MATDNSERKQNDSIEVGAADGPTEVGATEARLNWYELVNRACYGGERIVITRRNKPIAAIVSAGDLARLQQADAAA